MKKIFKNKWFLLALGILLGAYLGADLALRYAITQKFEYDEMLQDHFIESRIWNIATSIYTIGKAENEDMAGVVSGNKMFLSGAFLTLVEIHKTGDYERKNAEMLRSLMQAKEFMVQRPNQFLDLELVTLSTAPDKDINLELNPHENSPPTNHPRQQLQDAFDYLERIQQQLN